MNCTSVSVANPDIDGIGVRVALYVQAALAFIVLPLSLEGLEGSEGSDGGSTHLKGDAVIDFCDASATAVLVNGCALLIASYIQGTRGSLSVYDAIIVLQLNWLNNLTVTLTTIILLAGKHRFKMAIFHIIHTMGTGAFGIWLFRDIQSWSPGCADEFDLFLFGRPLQATGPRLRTFILAWSSIFVIPVVNTIGLYFPYFWAYSNILTNPLALPQILIIFLIVFSVLIAATEDFIRWNSHAVVGASDQSTWTFGQISAVLLLAPPIWTMGTLILGSRSPSEETEDDDEDEAPGAVVELVNVSR